MGVVVRSKHALCLQGWRIHNMFWWCLWFEKISKNKIIIMTTHFFPCAGMKFEANNPSLEVSAFDLLATVYQCHHHCAEISEPSTCIFSKRLSLYRVFWNEIRPAHVGMTQGEIVSTPVGGRNMCPPTSPVPRLRTACALATKIQRSQVWLAKTNQWNHLSKLSKNYILLKRVFFLDEYSRSPPWQKLANWCTLWNYLNFSEARYLVLSICAAQNLS